MPLKKESRLTSIGKKKLLKNVTKSEDVSIFIPHLFGQFSDIFLAIFGVK